jgi:hypothetical protein
MPSWRQSLDDEGLFAGLPPVVSNVSVSAVMESFSPYEP